MFIINTLIFACLLLIPLGFYLETKKMNTKYIIIWILGISVIAGLIFTLYERETSRYKYSTCKEAKRDYNAEIPSTSWLYRPDLDSDKDGVACEFLNKKEKKEYLKEKSYNERSAALEQN